MIRKPKGFVPVMLSPFKDNGDIDWRIVVGTLAIFLTGTLRAKLLLKKT